MNRRQFLMLGAAVIYGCSGCYDRPLEVSGVGSVYGTVIVEGRDEYGRYGGRYTGSARAVNFYDPNRPDRSQLGIGIFRYEGCREYVLRIMLKPDDMSNIRDGTLKEQGLLESFKISFENGGNSLELTLAQLKRMVGQLKEAEIGIVRIKYRVVGYDMDVKVGEGGVTLSHITPPVDELTKYDPGYIYLVKAPVVVVEYLRIR